MSKITKKYLTKLIAESLEESLSETGLSDKQKKSIIDQIKKMFDEDLQEAINLKSWGKNARRAAAIVGMGTALTTGAGLNKDARAEDTWQQRFAAGERTPEQRIYKFVAVTVKNIDTGKSATLTVPTDGKFLHIATLGVEHFLREHYGVGTFIILDSKGTDTPPPPDEDQAPVASRKAEKSAAKAVKSDDGKTVTVTDAKDGDDAREAARKLFVKRTSSGGVEREVLDVEFGKTTQTGPGSFTIEIKRSALEESRVTRYLKRIILEELQECGMIPASANMAQVAANIAGKAAGGNVDPDGYEGKMAKGNLFKMAKSASELHNMFQDNENLEPWVEEKIAVAARMIDDVADYMSYEKTRG